MRVKGNHVAVLEVKHPRYRYKVAWRQGGKPKSKYFRDREKTVAETYAAQKRIELENEGNKEGAITDDERLAVLVARKELAPFDGADLEKAVRFYADYLKRNVKPATIAELSELRIQHAEGEGCSIRHVLDLKSRLKAFKAAFGDRQAETMRTEDVERWLLGLDVAPQTFTNYRRVVSGLFEFARRRGFCTENPVKHAARKKFEDKPPGILTPEQTENLLNACPAELLPAIAIQAFAGVRTAEMLRLTWDAVEGDYIRIEGKVAKTAQRRLIPISATLAAWLEPFRKNTGKIAPGNFAKKCREARAGAGIEKWPDNGLRHSFASYKLAKTKNAADVAADLGHSNASIVYRHYREVVTPEAAEMYLSIRPKVIGMKGVKSA